MLTVEQEACRRSPSQGRGPRARELTRVSSGPHTETDVARRCVGDRLMVAKNPIGCAARAISRVSANRDTARRRPRAWCCRPWGPQGTMDAHTLRALVPTSGWLPGEASWRRTLRPMTVGSQILSAPSATWGPMQDMDHLVSSIIAVRNILEFESDTVCCVGHDPVDAEPAGVGEREIGVQVHVRV